jgi:O-antigen/teichoic acid export membrane protein
MLSPMTSAGPPSDIQRHDRAIAQGAFVNGLGIAGKALIPLFFILSAWLYGTEAMGVFYLAFTMIDVAVSLVSSGFTTGALMFASRYVEEKDKETLLYRSLANGFAISIAAAVLMIVFSRVGGPQLVLMKYPQANLLGSLQIMVLSLPFTVITAIVVSATKAHLTMKWETLLVGFLRPVLLTIFALAFFALGLGLNGLVWGYAITQAVLGILSIIVFGCYFSYSQLFYHFRNFKFFSPLVSFAVPQSLNMTFNTFITNLDVLMLGYFGYNESMLWVYGMGAQIVRNIRQVKLALSGSLAPVVARLHEKGDMSGMSETFSMVTRWATSIALPLALIVAILRLDFMHLFDSSYNGETSFLLILLIPPLLSCTLGLAGNIVVITGHSKWNLFNSMTIAFLNVCFNLLLIPKYGMIGAAAATVIASVIFSIMQLVEAKKLVGARLIFSRIYKPFAAIALPALLAVASSAFPAILQTLAQRIAVAVVCTAIYVVVLYLMGVDPRDKEALLPRRFREKSPPTQGSSS